MKEVFKITVGIFALLLIIMAIVAALQGKPEIISIPRIILGVVLFSFVKSIK